MAQSDGIKRPNCERDQEQAARHVWGEAKDLHRYLPYRSATIPSSVDAGTSSRASDTTAASTLFARCHRADTEACRVERSGYPCLLYTSPSPRDRTRSRM